MKTVGVSGGVAYIYIDICVYIFIHLTAYMLIYLNTHVLIYGVYISMAYLQICTRMYTFLHRNRQLYIYLWTYVCVFIYVYVQRLDARRSIHVHGLPRISRGDLHPWEVSGGYAAKEEESAPAVAGACILAASGVGSRA